MSGSSNGFSAQILPESIQNLRPRVGLVLGSGLGGFVERIDSVESIPYSEIEGLPVSKVPGHEGRFVFGEVGGVEVVIAQGRVHLYEGWTAAEIGAGVRAMAAMGIEILILTNAAGIVNPAFKPGSWMQITDHLNFTGASPLTGGPHFIDQSDVYSKRLRNGFAEQAGELGIDLNNGVYAWLPGPQYETPAEIRMLGTLGADAVGMSTVPEAIQARALGLEVAGFSCLTNFGAGLSGDPLAHEEVVEVGAKAADQLVNLLEKALPAI